MSVQHFREGEVNIIRGWLTAHDGQMGQLRTRSGWVVAGVASSVVSVGDEAILCLPADCIRIVPRGCPFPCGMSSLHGQVRDRVSVDGLVRFDVVVEYDGDRVAELSVNHDANDPNCYVTTGDRVSIAWSVGRAHLIPAGSYERNWQTG